MGLIDMFIPKDQVAKADAAITVAEANRKDRIRKILFTAGVTSEAIVDSIFSTSSQATSLREAGNAAGKGPLSEILNKIADKLESR